MTMPQWIAGSTNSFASNTVERGRVHGRQAGLLGLTPDEGVPALKADTTTSG